MQRGSGNRSPSEGQTRPGLSTGGVAVPLGEESEQPALVSPWAAFVSAHHWCGCPLCVARRDLRGRSGHADATLGPPGSERVHPERRIALSEVEASVPPRYRHEPPWSQCCLSVVVERTDGIGGEPRVVVVRRFDTEREKRVPALVYRDAVRAAREWRELRGVRLGRRHTWRFESSAEVRVDSSFPTGCAPRVSSRGR